MKPKTPKKLTKKQRRFIAGPNAVTKRSLDKGHVYSSRTGRDYHGVEGLGGLPLVRRKPHLEKNP